MAAIDLLETEIKRFLASDEPEVLCISGDWGVGKTYSWNKLLEKIREEHAGNIPRYSYASLFGLSSIEELKSEICGSISIVVSENLGLFEKGKNAAIGFLENNKSAAKSLPKIRDYLNAIEHFQFSLIKNQIVCIDDLERMNKGLGVQDVFGLISQLREQRSCKVVLLLNKDELDKIEIHKKDFEEHSEKVIDVFLKFEPTSQEAMAIADPDKGQEGSFVSDDCVLLNISNIRVIKKIARLANIIRPCLGDYDEQITKDILHSLTLFAWCKYQPTLAPSHEHILKYYTGGFLGMAKKAQEMNDEEKKWEAILSSYGFSAFDEIDQVVLEFVNDGYLDSESLKSAADVRQKALTLEAMGHSFSEAWDLYHGSFDDNKAEFVEALYESFLKGVHTITPLNLTGSVKIFKDLGEAEKAAKIISFYIAERNEVREFWSSIPLHRFPGDIDDPDVKKAFQEKYDSYDPDFDPVATLMKIGGDSGWSKEETRQLGKLTVDDFYKIFMITKGKELSIIVKSALMLNENDISKTATAALVKIGGEAPINERRVRAFGIEIKK